MSWTENDVAEKIWLTRAKVRMETSESLFIKVALHNYKKTPGKDRRRVVNDVMTYFKSVSGSTRVPFL